MTDTKSSAAKMPEPWLRGTMLDVPAVIRGVLHALELAGEDALRWCGGLKAEELNARTAGLPSVGFQLRHIAGSLDRLLTYAEGRDLDEVQLTTLKQESEAVADRDALLKEFADAMERSAARVRAFVGLNLEEVRVVGRRRLPTTVGGLLVHCADHTQRHVGQMVTTVKVVRATSPRSE
jgi:uncharacterized damage-inducible protein DinB